MSALPKVAPWTEDWAMRKILRLAGPVCSDVRMFFRDTGFLGYEADVLILRKCTWLEEVEVKVSLADFKADLKKRKHKWLIEGRPTYNRGAQPLPLKWFGYAVPSHLVPLVKPLLPPYAGLVDLDAANSHISKCRVVEPTVLPLARPVTPEEVRDLMFRHYFRSIREWADRLARDSHQNNGPL